MIELARNGMLQRVFLSGIELVVISAVLLIGESSLRSVFAGACVVALGWTFRLLAHGANPLMSDERVCGPYRYMRHPYLFGFLLTMLGYGLWAKSFPLMIAILILLLITYSFWRYFLQAASVGQDSSQSSFWLNWPPLAASEAMRFKQVFNQLQKSPLEWTAAFSVLIVFAVTRFSQGMQFIPMAKNIAVAVVFLLFVYAIISTARKMKLNLA